MEDANTAGAGSHRLHGTARGWEVEMKSWTAHYQPSRCASRRPRGRTGAIETGGPTRSRPKLSAWGTGLSGLIGTTASPLFLVRFPAISAVGKAAFHHVLRRSIAICSAYPSLQGYRDRGVEKPRTLPYLLQRVYDNHCDRTLEPKSERQAVSGVWTLSVSFHRDAVLVAVMACRAPFSGEIMARLSTDGNSVSAGHARTHTSSRSVGESWGIRMEPLRHEAPGHCFRLVMWMHNLRFARF
ncbi:hypothetical protein QBC45DRAFT_245815 [Copromyces sp. CBS 386.78]|nr:hypothetical protein QBC45DRAFT_245815 [Copromyces sp. CBS 386.78]